MKTILVWVKSLLIVLCAFAGAAVVVVMLLAAVGSSSSVTATQTADCRVRMNDYGRLQSGMSYSQVASILGCAGTERVRTDSGSYHGAIYGWQGYGSLGANMTAQFHDDAMISKAQFGLQ